MPAATAASAAGLDSKAVAFDTFRLTEPVIFAGGAVVLAVLVVALVVVAAAGAVVEVKFRYNVAG